MMNINTVLGPIAPEELGVTLIHEHLYCEIHRVSGRLGDILVDTDAIVEDLQAFARLGGATVCDVTTSDLGQDPRKLREIAQRSGINVLMSVGLYRGSFYEPSLHQRRTSDIAEEFVRIATTGIDGVLPALIGEIGVDGAFVSPAEERVHRAAARAQIATGLPVMTHTIQTRAGLEQLALLEEEGVDPSRVAVGHCDSLFDDAYHDEVVRRGAFASFDLIRGLDPRTTARQLESVVRLADAGFIEQILLSQDVCYHAHLSAYGGKGYTFVIGAFAQQLRNRGFSTVNIETILVRNPARFLSAATL
jgi:phosphotriesterase-related protein